MDLAQIAADIARNVGREFPDPLVPWQEMTLRQLASLAEEVIELAEARETNDPDLPGELCDASLTPYMVAHYAGIDLDSVVNDLDSKFTSYGEPWRVAGDVLKAGRRYLGIARRSGTKEEFAATLGRLVLAVRQDACHANIDLDQAIADKVEVIFSRGWKEGQIVCGSCGLPILGRAWRHVRLNVHIHARDACLSSVRGEDVRKHCMESLIIPPAGEVTVGVPSPGL